jgi:hypothetical protein
VDQFPFQILEKMMRLIVSIFIFLSSICGYTQDISLIKIDSLYKETGVIFPKEYELSIIIQNMDKRYTPSLKDVAKADKIFLDNYNLANKSNSITKEAKSIPNTRKYFNCFIRQYVGYYDTKGNKNILIHLIDNSKPKKVRKRIGDGWRKYFVIIFAQPMPFDILTYRVDISDEKLYVDF